MFSAPSPQMAGQVGPGGSCRGRSAPHPLAPCPRPRTGKSMFCRKFFPNTAMARDQSASPADSIIRQRQPAGRRLPSSWLKAAAESAHLFRGALPRLGEASVGPGSPEEGWRD